MEEGGLGGGAANSLLLVDPGVEGRGAAGSRVYS